MQINIKRSNSRSTLSTSYKKALELLRSSFLHLLLATYTIYTIFKIYSFWQPIQYLKYIVSGNLYNI